MKIDLNEQELEVIECMFSGWGESDGLGLYRGLSYQFVYDLCVKLGIRAPVQLNYLCSEQYEKDMDVT